MSFRVYGPKNNLDSQISAKTYEGKPDSEMSAKELVEKYKGNVPAEALNGWKGSIADLEKARIEYFKDHYNKNHKSIRDWVRELISGSLIEKRQALMEKKKAIEECTKAIEERVKTLNKNIAALEELYCNLEEEFANNPSEEVKETLGKFKEEIEKILEAKEIFDTQRENDLNEWLAKNKPSTQTIEYSDGEYQQIMEEINNSGDLSDMEEKISELQQNMNMLIEQLKAK